MIRIVGICGSLRSGSFNRKTLVAATKLVPENGLLEIVEIAGIPLYNQDLEVELPAEVVKFKAAIKAADAVLFVTPEYNYSIPGVLKNAIDWASRPSGDNSFRGKTAAIMGASPGRLGSARAQYHLRQVLVALNMVTLNSPEVMISAANNAFDDEGSFSEEKTAELVQSLIVNLIDLTRRLGVDE